MAGAVLLRGSVRGTARHIQPTSFVQSNRIPWDQIPGNFDDSAGLFDDVGGSDQVVGALPPSLLHPRPGSASQGTNWDALAGPWDSLAGLWDGVGVGGSVPPETRPSLISTQATRQASLLHPAPSAAGGAGLWDGIVGLWDSLAGQFDDIGSSGAPTPPAPSLLRKRP